jgi:hypothetical protein
MNESEQGKEKYPSLVMVEGYISQSANDEGDQ